MDSDNNTLPTNFRTLVADFVNDLTRVFPEYDIHWRKYADPDISDNELHILLDHCSKVYPERFFDILYQNEELFINKENSELLPNIYFCELYNDSIVTSNIKETIWKYLQCILFSIVPNIQDKDSFGINNKLFEVINREEFKNKLENNMLNIYSKCPQQRDWCSCRCYLEAEGC